MSKNDNITEREAIEALLPWYGKGQLDNAEMRRVEDYLAAHPDMAHQLELIEEERGETVLLNEARGAPSPGALDRLMDSIEMHEAENPSLASTKQAIWGWASRLVGAPVPAKLQWIAAAAAILIIAQGVSLGVLMTSGVSRGPGYETASGPGQSTTRGVVVKGTYALVQFAEEAKASEINGFLTEMGFTVVEGPKPGGVYRIRISEKKLDIPARDTILDKIQERSELFTLVAPAE